MGWDDYSLTEDDMSLTEALETLSGENAFSESVRDLRPRIQAHLGRGRDGTSFQMFEDAGVTFESTGHKRGRYLVTNLNKLRAYIQPFRNRNLQPPH